MSYLIRRSVRATVAVALAVTVALGLGISAVHANPPTKVKYPVDVSYPLDDLSDICGFEVWLHLQGTFKGTIHTNRSGIASELDTQPATRLTTYSPETGKSFTVMFSTVFHTVYPDGLVPGGRVIADVTGFVDKVPGTHASAGRTHFPNGVIVEVIDGVPYVNYGYPDLSHASLYGDADGDHLDALTCSRLAP